MRSYYVAVESAPHGQMFGFFGISYFICDVAEGQPVNNETFYELINSVRDVKDKTGNVIAWSKIETK